MEEKKENSSEGTPAGTASLSVGKLSIKQSPTVKSTAVNENQARLKINDDDQPPRKSKRKKQVSSSKKDSEWRKILTKDEYKILRKRGTERSGKGEYNRKFPQKGYFGCRGCKHPIYSAASKFPDRGWVAFDKCYFTDSKCHVGVRQDLGGLEIVCNNCGGHLGHVFYGEQHTKTNERH